MSTGQHPFDTNNRPAPPIGGAGMAGDLPHRPDQPFSSAPQGDTSFASLQSQNFMEVSSTYSPVGEPAGDQQFYHSQQKMGPSQSFVGMNSYASDYQPHQSSNSLYERDNASVSTNQMQDPYPWMTMSDVKEPDDELHDPTKREHLHGSPQRALLNIGTLIVVVLALLMLFAGYPILHHFRDDKNDDLRQQYAAKLLEVKPPKYADGRNFFVGRANGSTPGIKDERLKMLIDPDTPQEAYQMQQFYSGGSRKNFQLVFSDEFNVDGRTFYPGDDPFWEAVDLHYWATNNFEWYDPAAVTTKGGSLRIKLEEHPFHGLNFRGGMLQSWNKFCFRGGIITGRIQLPGYRNAGGLWPAFWLMGNLGRAGYGASLEGTWPYSYDQCDVGTVQNQTLYNEQHPQGYPPLNFLGGATVFNEKHNTTSLSFLPGQKLSACTCPGEDHPGPKVNGGFRGRAAPEIDVFEAQTTGGADGHVGVSQSCQMAPYNWLYDITMNHEKNQGDPEYNNTIYQMFRNQGRTGDLNSYTGEVTQQSLSGVSWASQQAVQKVAQNNYGARYLDPTLREDGDLAQNFAEYSLEFKPGTDGYAAWTSNGQPTWELHSKALQPDPRSMIGERMFPDEPMYILLNLGISQNFGNIDWEDLMGGFPYEMAFDYVRVYQDPDAIDIGCDTEEYPTKEYIQRHADAYNNADLTIWGGSPEEGGYGADWPKNRLYNGNCNGPHAKHGGDPSPAVPQPKATLLTNSDAVTSTVISNPATIVNPATVHLPTPRPTL